MTSDEANSDGAEYRDAIKDTGRRRFLQKTAFGVGGVGLGALAWDSLDQGVASVTNNNSSTNNGNSTSGTVEGSAKKPSTLRITDVRVAVLTDTGAGSAPIVKVHTNQGITGLGEARDGADHRYILMLKGLLLDRNPLNIEEIHREMRRYGDHGRAGGGVSAINMALYDIAGKFYDTPAHQLIGGQYRKKVRLYSDTPGGETAEETAKQLVEKVNKAGYTAVKMDLGINELTDVDGALVNADLWKNKDGDLSQYGYGEDNVTGPTYGSAEHYMTRIQITEKGLNWMENYVKTVREAIGYDILFGMDHFGHFPIKEHIQLAKRFKKYDIAYMENIAPWFETDQIKRFTKATTVPSMVGEDIYGLDPSHTGSGSPKIGFKALIDQDAVDMIHPDPATAGGITETKKIGDYAAKHGKAMFLHYAGSPIGAMAATHIASACRNFVALENHSYSVDFWGDLVTRPGMEDVPLLNDGFHDVPEGPGLGVELNEEVAKKHHDKEIGWFEETEKWNDGPSRQFWE